MNNDKASKSTYAATASAADAYSAGYQSKKRSSTSTTSDGKEDSSKKKTKGNLPCEVALAKSWNESTNPTGYYMSEKLDGMRCIWDGKGNLYSRNGNLVMAPLFFLNALPTGTVLDGELFLERGEFQQCMSIARQSKPDANDWRSLTLVIFDAPLVSSYKMVHKCFCKIIVYIISRRTLPIIDPKTRKLLFTLY